MPNATIDTNYYANAIALNRSLCRDEVLVFSGAAKLLKGTILGRVTASGKLRPYAAGNNDGSQNPIAVLTYEVEALGAGDISARCLIDGEVNRNRLVIAADGNGNNITPALLDQLRDYGIVPIDVQALGQVV